MGAPLGNLDAILRSARDAATTLYDEGGWVLVAIVIASVAAWGLLFSRWVHLRAQRRAYQRAGRGLYGDGPASPAAMEMWVSGEVGRLYDGLGTIQALAALLPLLGLLGTVLGMLQTFEVIQVEGTGDARLMADGIRQALLTTQAGILAALPVLLGLRYLNSRAGRIANRLELDSHAAVAGSRNGGSRASDASYMGAPG